MGESTIPLRVIPLSMHQGVCWEGARIQGVRVVYFGVGSSRDKATAIAVFSARELRIIADLATQAADWVEGKE